MDRRTFLALTAAAVATAGCTADPPVGPRPTTSAPPRDDPDARVRERVAESEAALIAAYRAALVAEPALGDLLAPLLGQHEAHLRQVAPGWTGATGTPAPDHSGSAQDGAGVGSPGAVATVTPSDSAASPATAGTRVRALESLAAAESAATQQRITACDAAVDPGLARLLCLVAASEAQHASVLVLAVEGSS